MSLISPAPWPRERDGDPLGQDYGPGPARSTTVWPRTARRTKSCTECQRRKQKVSAQTVTYIIRMVCVSSPTGLVLRSPCHLSTIFSPLHTTTSRFTSHGLSLRPHWVAAVDFPVACMTVVPVNMIMRGDCLLGPEADFDFTKLVGHFC